MGSLAPWMILEAVLFVGGAVVLMFASRRGPLRPVAWWPAPALMGGLGLAMAMLRESRVPVVLDGIPFAELATAARLWHAQTAHDVWLVLILLVAWCLGAAWCHGRVRADGLRLAVGTALAGLALASGESRLLVSAVAILASASAPGALGMAAGLLAAASGFAAHIGWIGRALTEADPLTVRLALLGSIAWGLAAVGLSGPALRSEHSAGFGVGWVLGIGALATWLSTSGEAQAPYAPAALGALDDLGVDLPDHHPARMARLRGEDCVWYRRPEGWTRVSGGVRCPGPSAGEKHFVAVEGDRPLAEVVGWGPGEWRLLVEAHEGSLPGDLDRWRWSWEPVRVVAEGSRFRPGADAVRIAWRDGIAVLPEHADVPVDDASLAEALDEGPVRVDLLAEPDEHVTVEQWLALCRAARSHRRFVRCGVRG